MAAGHQAVTQISDVDQDKIPDLVVGAYRANAIHIISGGKGTIIKSIVQPNAPMYGSFGATHASIGDINGDSYIDFCVGYPYVNGRNGKVLAFSGKPPFALIYSISGSSNSYFGTDCRTGPDLDGDKFADYFVGANHDRSGSLGAVYAVSAKTGKVIYRVTGSGYYGSLISVGGDVDGDGFGDLLAGRGFNYVSSGYVRLLSSKTGKTIWEFKDVGPAYFPSGMALCEDLNGDSTPDALISNGLNRVDAVSGKTGKLVYSIKTPAVHSIESLGDIDGDGRGDFACGMPRAVKNSQPLGAVFLYSGRTGKVLKEYWGVQAGAQFGTQVSKVADLNGNGGPDLVIGAPLWKVGTKKMGAILFYDIRVPRSKRAAYIAIGKGCPSSSRLVPTLSATTLPVFGKSMVLDLKNVGPITPTFLLFGFTPSVPLNLKGLGAPGCTLYANPHVIRVRVTDATGSWYPKPSFPIPSAPNLIGASFYNQVFVYDPKANALKLVASNGAKATIGF